MRYTVELSERAEQDLYDIYVYIANELQTPKTAYGQLERLKACILSLEYMPERFRLYPKEPWKSRNLHIVSVDHYCVLYIVESKGRVVVLRIMYGGRDIDAQLSQ